MINHDFENMNVLIVEDSPTQALLLQRSLEEQKMRVRVSSDGLEALQRLKEALPDLIISDIKMPRMDGYELCKKVKSDERTQNIPVILLTGLSDPMDVIQGIGCGGDSFLTKPCELNILLSTIHDARENAKLQRENILRKDIDFFFNDKRYQLQINPDQITSLLLSTYSNAIQKNLELERAYEELQKKNEELKQLNLQKNQFLGMAAHDLRNPLGVIGGYVDVLIETLKTKIDDKAMKMLTRIKSSSTLMLNLINDLLDISVIESGTVSLHLSRVDLPALVQENLTLLRSIADKKEIKLLFNTNVQSAKVNCDPNKVTQIVNNLISNAIKFSHPGDVIEVSIAADEKEIVMAVKDQGTGLSSEAKARLFQPFSKGSSVGTAGEKGTGLGLAITHKIVAEHKGKIWVESEVGKGSTFYVSLPKE